MADDEGKAGFSVDEYFANYSKKKKKAGEDDEDVAGLLKESRRKKDEGRERRRREEGDYGRLSDYAKNEEEEEHEERGPGMPRAAASGEKIDNRAVVIFAYALRAFAITVMGLLMLFALDKRVPGFDRAVGSPPATGTFIEFILENLLLFFVPFILLLIIQLLYYLLDWFAHKKWKAYVREEIVYMIAFSLVGLAGSVIVVMALGY